MERLADHVERPVQQVWKLDSEWPPGGYWGMTLRLGGGLHGEEAMTP